MRRPGYGVSTLTHREVCCPPAGAPEEYAVAGSGYQNYDIRGSRRHAKGIRHRGSNAPDQRGVVGPNTASCGRSKTLDEVSRGPGKRQCRVHDRRRQGRPPDDHFDEVRRWCLSRFRPNSDPEASVDLADAMVKTTLSNRNGGCNSRRLQYLRHNYLEYNDFSRAETRVWLPWPRPSSHRLRVRTTQPRLFECLA